jgi:signal transduction histidine kinase
MTRAAGYAAASASDVRERIDFARRAAELAHDLNNAFTPITGYTSLVRDELAASGPALDVAQMLLDLDVVLGATLRAVGLSKELLTLASAQVGLEAERE